MASIRAAVVTMPPIVAELLTTLFADLVDLDVVACFLDRASAQAELGALTPDLVLLGLEAGESDAAANHLLTRLPRARVIALAHDGRSISVHEMRPHRTVLADISTDELVAVLQDRLLALRI